MAGEPVELLTVDDVARITQLSPYTIRETVRAGELRGHKLRGRIRVHPDDLAAWINANRLPAVPARSASSWPARSARQALREIRDQ